MIDHLKIVAQLLGGYQAEEFCGDNLLGDCYVKELGLNGVEKNAWMVHGDRIYSLSSEQRKQAELFLNPVFQEKVRASVHNGNDLLSIEKRLKKGEDLVIYETVNVCYPQQFHRLEFSRESEGGVDYVFVSMIWGPLAASGDLYTLEKDASGYLVLRHYRSIWIS